MSSAEAAAAVVAPPVKTTSTSDDNLNNNFCLSEYMNYNHIEQPPPPPPHHSQMQPHHMYIHGGSLVGDGGQYHTHPHYQDYEHYPPSAQYANSVSYGGPGGGGVGVGVGGVGVGQIVGGVGVGQGYLGDYGGNDRPGTPPSPSDHSGSPSPLPMSVGQQHSVVPPIAYLQAPYDEMPDYRITPSPGGQVDRYQDDAAAMVYGYVSTSPYGSTGMHPGVGGVVGPSNPTYDTRPIVYEESLNGPSGGQLGGVVPGGNLMATRSMFEDEEELQKHMSNLAMHGHGMLGHGMTTSPGSAGGIGGGGGGGGGGGSGGSIIGGPDDDQRPMRWRDPNLTEVISFLNNPNNIIKANAAAYLQHLCYMDDPNKQRTRTLGGIPPLVKLLAHESPEVYRNACGALRNLSYGRQNDENKRSIKNAGGIISLINLLKRTNESEVKELVTGVIWNMSSCEDLKRSIIDEGVNIIVTYIIIPHSGWDHNSPGDTCWSTVFRNASGVLRNVSSAGEYARTKLRECDGLVDSLLYVVRTAIEKANIGNKIVENCVCILRNLSYRCQEVEDPNYDKHPLPTQSRVAATTSSSKGENLGCFGASKKKKDSSQNETKDNVSGGSGNGNGAAGASGNGPAGSGNGGGSGTASRSSIQRQEPIKGYELLWQPEVVQSYLALLQSCSNPETLEAAAGALQNLAACYWQPSIEIRAAVRKEKGLPILVELLRMEVDRVVCAVATALRNLAIDQRNKELIGKYAMRDLVQKLPSGNPQHDQGTSDDTIAAVLATLNEVIKKNAEFSRSLLDAGGVERLMNITRQRQKYTPRVLKFAGQVLFTMWQHQELREVYKKHGWKEQDFVTKTVAARNAAPNSPNNANSTLNRPMASQGGTRYEDRTMKRPPAPSSVSRAGVGADGVGNGGNGNGGVVGMGVATGGVNMIPSQSGSGPIYQRNDDLNGAIPGLGNQSGQQCHRAPPTQCAPGTLFSENSTSGSVLLSDYGGHQQQEQQQQQYFRQILLNGRDDDIGDINGGGDIRSVTATAVTMHDGLMIGLNGEPLYAQINRDNKRRHLIMNQQQHHQQQQQQQHYGIYHNLCDNISGSSFNEINWLTTDIGMECRVNDSGGVNGSLKNLASRTSTTTTTSGKLIGKKKSIVEVAAAAAPVIPGATIISSTSSTPPLLSPPSLSPKLKFIPLDKAINNNDDDHYQSSLSLLGVKASTTLHQQINNNNNKNYLIKTTKDSPLLQPLKINTNEMYLNNSFNNTYVNCNKLITNNNNNNNTNGGVNGGSVTFNKRDKQQHVLSNNNNNNLIFNYIVNHNDLISNDYDNNNVDKLEPKNIHCNNSWI